MIKDLEHLLYKASHIQTQYCTQYAVLAVNVYANASLSTIVNQK